MQRAMLADYSWDASAEQYVALYRRAHGAAAIAARAAGKDGVSVVSVSAQKMPTMPTQAGARA